LRYFSSKKYSVEMFSACMQEVNLKKFIIFNLFYLLFCFGPQVCKEIPASGFVELSLLAHPAVLSAGPGLPVSVLSAFPSQG
jgi:hypothetical protein